MSRLMHRDAYEAAAFALAVGVAEVGLKLSSLLSAYGRLRLATDYFSSPHRAKQHVLNFASY